LFTAAAVLMLAGGCCADGQGAGSRRLVLGGLDHRGPAASAIQAMRFGREFGRGSTCGDLLHLRGQRVRDRARSCWRAALAIPAVALGV
jgi:hypothetical protein